MSKKSLLLILPLILLFWFWALGRPAQGQAPCAARDGGDGDINWYCALPQVPVGLNPVGLNPLPAAGGCGGMLTTPQAITYARTFYNPDSELLSTSDSVAVPAEFHEGGSPLSGNCFGDYYAFWVSFVQDLGNGPPFPPGVVWTDVDGDGTVDSIVSEDGNNNNVCDGCEWIDANGDHVVDAGEFVDANGDGVVDHGEDTNGDGELDRDTITLNMAAFKPSLPASCRQTVSTPVLVSDGDQDLADVFQPDNQPDMPNTLIWGTMKEDGTPVGLEIPDPTDCFLAGLSVPTEEMAPIDTIHADLDGDGRPETAIVNLLPLNVNYWETYAAFDDGNFFWGLLPLWSFPYPGFMANPNLQTEGPLFAVGDNFVEGGGPTFIYNRENEATTTVAPKNWLSQPFAIEAGDFFGEDPALDLAILHQRWLNVPEPPDNILAPPLLAEPIFTPCTNVDAGGEFSDPDLDLGFLAFDIMGFMGEIFVHGGITMPFEFRNLSYLTSHRNLGGNAFAKQPDNASPFRFCTGINSDATAMADFNGNTRPDIAVANFGGCAGPFALGAGAPAGTFGEIAGGANFLTDYDGGGAQVNNLPIVPVGQGHPNHPIDVACGDMNGDGRDDCAFTYLDAMGLSLDVKRIVNYSVPDIIRSGETDFGGCPDFGAPFLPPGCLLDGNFYSYDTSDPNLDRLEEWKCQKLPDEAANPANMGEYPPDGDPLVGDPVDGVVGPPWFTYNIHRCEGEAKDPTCPRFDRAHAIKFEYKATYRFLVDEAMDRLRDAWDADPEIACSGIVDDPDSPPPIMMFTCQVPGFESWKCISSELDLDDVVEMGGRPLYCTGTTTSTAVTDLPAPLDQVPPLTCAGVPCALDWQYPFSRLVPPVERNMIFQCGYDIHLARDSEFCVYMNDGGGGFSNRHCVDMAQYPIPRIVPEYPVNLRLGSLGGAQEFGAKYMWVDSSVRALGRMALGTWPFAVDIVQRPDLCDTTGAPRPDGKADAVIGLNNSHYVAVICSKGGLEPYKSANVLWLDASTPRYKEDLRAYLQPQLDKIRDNQPLNFSDYLKLSIGMMSGTSSVTVPQEPINGLNEFNEPETRRSIVAIQSFPWRVMITSLNSLGGLIPEILSGIAPAMGGVGGGGPAPAKAPANMEAAPGGGAGGFPGPFDQLLDQLGEMLKP